MKHLWLAPTIAKCIGTACKYPGRCATREIAYTQGRPMADHSISPGIYVTPPCCAPSWSKRIDPANAVKPEEKPAARDWIGQ